MHADNYQPILWRLYTDATFRRSFIFDRQEFYLNYCVSPDIIYFLNSISIHEILFCAEELLKKRMNKVKNLLPFTFKLIGEDITVIFLKFTDLHSFKGVNRHHEDATQFIQYLLKHKSFSSSKHRHLYIKSVMLHEGQQIVEEKNKTVYTANDPFDPILNHRLALRKNQQKRIAQKFRVIGNNQGWIRDRRKRERKRKKYTTPFLSQRSFL